MHVRTRDGLSLHVQAFGQGPPVVMLHGISGNMMTWYWIAGRLRQRQRVVLFDLRGHGLSELSAQGYGVEAMADDLDAVLRELVAQPVALVGHSYGAMIALAFALREPARVRRMALVEPPYPFAARQAELAQLDGRGAEAVADALLPQPLRDAVIAGGRRGRRFLERGRQLVESTTCFEECRKLQDFPTSALARLAPPLLVINGSQSSCLAGGKQLTSIAPDARHVELSGGHNLPGEAALALSEELARFCHA